MDGWREGWMGYVFGFFALSEMQEMRGIVGIGTGLCTFGGGLVGMREMI
jgi:hypothetical protein